MQKHHEKINWHERYLKEVGTAEIILSRIADAVFTIWSFLAHLIIYPILMALEGGDFHLFLDAISIEAVFVSLCVGINTKLANKRADIAQQQRDHMQECIEQKIDADNELTQAVHGLTTEIHNHIVNQ